MKKILLLGGSAQQIIAIKTAKELGYYTVLCDFLTDNPGQHEADKFYLVSTTDKDAILNVAIEENVDGILAYASDPAAPTAAYVAEKMNLITNSYEAVETLCNKDKFRNFLLSHGFNAPVSRGYGENDIVGNELDEFLFPIIVKPVDSSGSKGITVVYDKSECDKAVEFAFSYSRSKRIIIEEFIEKKHKYLIGGDIFVKDGKVVLWGLLNCHRDACVNNLVPVGKSYPLDLEPQDEHSVKDTLQRMVDELGINFGAMNVELVVDSKGKVWPIDVGPRNGGNMIPDLLGNIFGVDVVKMTVLAAMGQPFDSEIGEGKKFCATHNLHANKAGRFDGINFSDDIEQYIVRKNIYKSPGDCVEFFDNAAKAIGIIFLEFTSESEMHRILDNVNEHVQILMQ